jgi:hypothetical protein
VGRTLPIDGAEVVVLHRVLLRIPNIIESIIVWKKSRAEIFCSQPTDTTTRAHPCGFVRVGSFAPGHGQRCERTF